MVGAKRNLNGLPLNAEMLVDQKLSSFITDSERKIESDQKECDSIARYKARVIRLETGPSARDIEIK